LKNSKLYSAEKIYTHNTHGQPEETITYINHTLINAVSCCS